jgi:hypothetical protein
LYAYDLESRKKKRITHDERVTSPVLIGDDHTVAYLTVADGTSNIRLLDQEDGTITTITDFSSGEYIHSLAYSPVDSILLFDATFNHGRQLMQLRLDDRSVTPYQPAALQVGGHGDMRDPSIMGSNLLLSTDVSGVYNVFQVKGNDEQGYITNVLGGAFMPSANANGELLYSIYHDGGYKIAYLQEPAYLDEGIVGKPTHLREPVPGSPQESPDMTLAPQPYEETYSLPFILPRLMVDYGTIKPGLYFYANEVLDRLLLFGGGSINSLKDADFFLLFEFRKFSPTLYAQIYAVRRHVSQEFKYYDYPGINDLRFDLIEGVIGGRLPAGMHRFWIEGTLSQYKEHILQTVAGERGELPSFPYYKGKSLTARWQLRFLRPQYAGNMFPTRGFESEMELRGEQNDLVSGFRISEDYSTLVPDFANNNSLRLTLNLKTYLPLHRERRIAASFEARLGWLSNTEIDTFFYFFGGGSPGLKGYTYYDSTVQGTNLMIHTVTVRAPLFLEQNIPLLHLILQDASVGFIAQFGDGFNGSWLKHRYKTSVGVEMRLKGYSFYVFPFALAYEVHRPLVAGSKGYRHYVSLLFDF